jgi:hypothetical protein
MGDRKLSDRRGMAVWEQEAPAGEIVDPDQWSSRFAGQVGKQAVHLGASATTLLGLPDARLQHCLRQPT